MRVCLKMQDTPIHGNLFFPEHDVGYLKWTFGGFPKPLWDTRRTSQDIVDGPSKA